MTSVWVSEAKTIKGDIGLEQPCEGSRMTFRDDEGLERIRKAAEKLRDDEPVPKPERALRALVLAIADHLVPGESPPGN